MVSVPAELENSSPVFISTLKSVCHKTRTCAPMNHFAPFSTVHLNCAASPAATSPQNMAASSFVCLGLSFTSLRWQAMCDLPLVSPSPVWEYNVPQWLALVRHVAGGRRAYNSKASPLPDRLCSTRDYVHASRAGRLRTFPRGCAGYGRWNVAYLQKKRPTFW